MYSTFLIWLLFVLSALKFPLGGQFWVIQATAGYSFFQPVPSQQLPHSHFGKQASKAEHHTTCTTLWQGQGGGFDPSKRVGWGKMREIAVHTATLAVDQLVCGSHVSKP